MKVAQILTTFGVSLFFGVLCALCCIHSAENRLLFGAIGTAVGVAGAITHKQAYPLIFNRLNKAYSWFGWVPFVFTPFIVHVLPATAILLPVGFLTGFSVMLPLALYNTAATFVPGLGCLIGFIGYWVFKANRLPIDVDSVVYVYRVYDPTTYTPSDEHTNDWVKFVEQHSGPGFGYEWFTASTVRNDPERFNGAQAPAAGEEVFIFVKEFRHYRELIWATHTVAKGSRTYSELVEQLLRMERIPYKPQQKGKAS